MKIISN